MEDNFLVTAEKYWSQNLSFVHFYPVSLSIKQNTFELCPFSTSKFHVKLVSKCSLSFPGSKPSKEFHSRCSFSEASFLTILLCQKVQHGSECFKTLVVLSLDQSAWKLKSCGIGLVSRTAHNSQCGGLVWWQIITPPPSLTNFGNCPMTERPLVFSYEDEHQGECIVLGTFCWRQVTADGAWLKASSAPM